ncbi:sulfotransferase 1C2-like [Oppia nitens]|uniref:sulfotransferase 1C2-like n=1 Tax=Oppia nitens TaxID=1686743 RepID=UPI0023DB5140|nr:sulfotransferase 1C2-like [Oppia nitens]
MAHKYKPTKNDLFIVSYPKCGTTWTQQIVHLLLNRGVPPAKTLLFSKSIPFLEVCAPTQDDTDTHVRAFKTHLPVQLAPFDDQSPAKYIYCIRNPKDCLISFWFHEKDFPLLLCDNFQQFFTAFMSGKTGYGDYFDHLIGWYRQRHRTANVLIVHYEDLKTDIEKQIRRIAKFISNDLLEQITDDKDFLDNVIKYSSFEFMKTSTNGQMKKFFDQSVDDMESDGEIVDGFKDAFRDIKSNDNLISFGDHRWPNPYP